jgi:hypothetical protein
VTKISQLSSIGDSLAIGDQFLIRDIDDVGSPNKSVTVSGITRALDTGTALAPAIAFASDKNTGIYSPSADTLAFVEGGTEAMRIDSSGRVGIGTTSPSTLLQCQQASAGSIGTFSFASSTGGGAEIRVANGYSGTVPIYSFWFNNSTGVGNPAANEISAIISGTERVRIDSSGRVGIGTSSPQQALSILGAVQKNISNIDGEEAGFIGKYESQGGNTAGMYFNNTLSANFSTWLSFKTTNSSNNLLTAMTIDASQRVGIGTSSPATTSALEVSGNQRYLAVMANAGAGGSTNPAVSSGLHLSWNRSNGEGESNIIYGTGAGGAPGLAIGSWNGTTYTERLRVDSNGFANHTGAIGRGAPVTKTGNFTVGIAENWLICNGTASITVTLPTASAWTGREIMLKTIAAFTVISASSNVVPLAGGAAGTAILAATAGKYATLVSDGTNWIIMQAN